MRVQDTIFVYQNHEIDSTGIIISNSKENAKLKMDSYFTVNGAPTMKYDLWSWNEWKQICELEEENPITFFDDLLEIIH